MMKRIIIFIGLISFGVISFAQNLEHKIDSINQEISIYRGKIDQLKTGKESLMLAYLRSQIKAYGLPKLEKGDTLIVHKAFMLVYSEKHEQAKWVAHIISTEILDGGEGRSNDFRVDPLVKTGSAEEKDYFIRKTVNGKKQYEGFGYDRGHLAPSADFKWSKQALSESYFYSNMSPQLATFNREGWAKLEGMLRNYVYENKVPLFVVTGPVLTDDLQAIAKSKNQVSIPKYFFKVAYDKQNSKAICFLVPHKELEYPIEYYAVSIDSAEAFTGIDFFANLNDSIENIIEAETDYKPFLPQKGRSDIVPIRDLPKNCVNTVQARKFVGKDKKVKVCGTVVSTHKSKKGHVFINLDKSFPNQIFSITIWASNIVNFSYKPESELTGKRICVTGKVIDYKGTPSMYIESEKQIKFLDSENK